MRVNHVEKSRQDQGQCGKCGVKLPAGCAYKWAKGRYTSRKVRCTDPKCAFRPSDLTESKMSAVYAAQEGLEDFMAEWASADGLEGVQSACSDCAESIREVASEYSEAAEAMGGAGEEMQTKADDLEGWADEIEEAGNQGEEFEVSYEDTEECPECGANADHEKGHKEEGHYLCSSKACGHEFKLDEEKDADGNTREDWAEEIRTAVSDALGNCPV